MANSPQDPNVLGLLQGALSQAEAIQVRIAAGEEVTERELNDLAHLLATQMEEVRVKLESEFGPIDPDALDAQMKQDLSPEDYSEWAAGERERLQFKKEFGLASPSSIPGGLN